MTLLMKKKKTNDIEQVRWAIQLRIPLTFYVSEETIIIFTNYCN